MLVAVRSKVIPLNWPVSDGIMIPKVQNPRQLISADNRQMENQRKIISEPESLFYQRLVTKNNLIDTVFQKGSIHTRLDSTHVNGLANPERCRQ